MKILAFGASNSTASINQQLAIFIAKQIPHEALCIVDLNDFEVSIFSPERKLKEGIPDKISQFIKHIERVDLVVISFAEYNGSYTAAFKNIFDWATLEKNLLFEGKKLFLASTSPSPRGGLSVLEAAIERFPRHGAQIVESFTLPSFHSNFDAENGIINKKFLHLLNQKLHVFHK